MAYTGYTIMMSSDLDGYQEQHDWFPCKSQAVATLAYLIWQNEYSYVHYWIEEYQDECTEDEWNDWISEPFIYLDTGRWGKAIHQCLIQHNITDSREFKKLLRDHPSILEGL